MTEGWRDRLDTAGEVAFRQAAATAGVLSRPRALRRLQQAAVLVAGVWGVISLARIAWSLIPVPQAPLPPLGDIINPARQTAAAVAMSQVDIASVTGWHLFGDPTTASSEELSQLEARRIAAIESRAGIEENARETRLPLLLTGVVSSSDDGLGYAMIEYQNEQAVYSVGDELPVAGRVVSLVKVLPSQAVIDNGGNYELLKLFDDNELMRQAGSRVDPVVPGPGITDGTPPRAVEVDNATLAAQYRDRLYSNPQSLAEVVQVAPVRRDGDLVGYRLSPGRAGQDFKALGFAPGDIVTAVNGLSLSDPANTLRLYQAMRDERSAVFELQREGSEIVLSVQLPESGSAK